MANISAYGLKQRILFKVTLLPQQADRSRGPQLVWVVPVPRVVSCVLSSPVGQPNLADPLRYVSPAVATLQGPDP